MAISTQPDEADSGSPDADTVRLPVLKLPFEIEEWRRQVNQDSPDRRTSDDRRKR